MASEFATALEVGDRDAGVRVTVNTDDPLIFGCTLSGEFLALHSALHIEVQLRERLPVRRRDNDFIEGRRRRLGRLRRRRRTRNLSTNHTNGAATLQCHPGTAQPCPGPMDTELARETPTVRVDGSRSSRAAKPG